MNDSVDLVETKPTLARSRLSIVTGLCCVLMLAAFLGGAAALADASTNIIDVAKFLGVAAFIGAMLLVAFGMIGDAFCC